MRVSKPLDQVPLLNALRLQTLQRIDEPPMLPVNVPSVCEPGLCLLLWHLDHMTVIFLHFRVGHSTGFARHRNVCSLVGAAASDVHEVEA